MDSFDEGREANPILEALRQSACLPTSEEHPASDAPIMHVFLVDAPTEGPPIVEGSAGPAPGSSPGAAEQQREQGPRQGRVVPLPRLSLLALLGCVLVVLTAGVWVLLPLWTSTVTITIVPVQQPITAQTRATIVTSGPANPAHGQIPGRLLPTLSLVQAQSVATTGTGAQPATRAQGSLTFYNAAQTAQTIAAGTLLTTTQGVEIVTEQDALIPAASYPLSGPATIGQATVPAQVVQVGPSGNLSAGVLNGPCCRENVFVVSHAFTGGQNARSYPMVAQRDLDGAVSILKASLMQSVTAASQVQLRGHEALVTPIACTPTISSDHPVGAEARMLTVTVTETCHAVAYDAQALADLMSQRVAQQAAVQLGSGSVQSGAVQTSVDQVNPASQPHDPITMQVKAVGVWASQFSQEQLNQLAQMLAGKSRQQALTLLLHTPGIQQVSFAAGDETLPADAAHIHLAVLYTA